MSLYCFAQLQPTLLRRNGSQRKSLNIGVLGPKTLALIEWSVSELFKVTHIYHIADPVSTDARTVGHDT